MNISLGNLTIDKFEERCQTKFSDEDKKWLEEHRTDIANGEKGKFHIFDMPFSIQVDTPIVSELVGILQKYNDLKPFAEELIILEKED